jgi:hypothetical protein
MCNIEKYTKNILKSFYCGLENFHGNTNTMLHAIFTVKYAKTVVATLKNHS